jgi:hypothetical protein
MKRLDFVNALKKVMPGVDQKENMMGLDFVMFDEEWISSYNDLLSISYPLKTGVVGSVHAEELFKVVTKMVGDDLVFDVAEDKKGTPYLIVKDDRTTLKMVRAKEDAIKERINFLELDKIVWKELSPDFKEGIELCSFSASSDPMLGSLAGLCFHNGTIYSTDNYRISKYVTSKDWNASFILPTESINGILKFDEIFTRVGLSKAWAHFKTKSGALLSSRLLTGTFPIDRINNILNRETDMNNYQFPKDLINSLDRTAILAGAESDELSNLTYIVISREGTNMVVKGRKDIGEIIENLSWETNPMPEGIEMAISPSFLKKILGITSNFKIGKQREFILFEMPKFTHFLSTMASRRN